MTDLAAAFANCPCFNQPLAAWSVGHVKKLRATFAGAVAFNQPLDGWDPHLGRVLSLWNTFDGAVAFNQPLSSRDVSAVRSLYRAFAGTASFDHLGRPRSSRDDRRGDASRRCGLQPANRHLKLCGVHQTDGMFAGAVSFNQSLDQWGHTLCV